MFPALMLQNSHGQGVNLDLRSRAKKTLVAHEYPVYSKWWFSFIFFFYWLCFDEYKMFYNHVFSWRLRYIH